MARRSTRIGIRIGRSGFVSTGRTGLRVGGRIGPVKVSSGRTGTRIGAGRGRAFASTWIPNSRRRPAPGRRQPQPLIFGFLLLCFVIGLISHLTGHG